MSDSASWFAKKLGTARPAPQQQPAYQPPPSYPQGPNPPPHVPPVPQPQHIQVTKDNIAEVAGMWQGGKATKTETARCPNCGGDKYFSMANGESLGGAGARLATERGMANTSPRCFECGYTMARPLQTGAM